MDGGITWSKIRTNVKENLYAVSFYDEKIGFAVGSNGLILRTQDGGLSWADQESPTQANLFAVSALGRNEAIATGELGTVIVTGRGGRKWEIQPNITANALQAVVDRGGNEVWVAGRGGTILKRSLPLSPNPTASPRLPPMLRIAGGRIKPSVRTPLITVTDDGDIPKATPPKN
jgi:photosystem II stability/assembly factor-like uncharacterized protein